MRQVAAIRGLGGPNAFRSLDSFQRGVAQEYLQYWVYYRSQGASNVRPHPHLSGSWFLRRRCCLRLRLRQEAPMIFNYWLAGIVTAGLLVYLTYALLRPEKF